MSTPYEIKLSNGATNFLRNMLNSTGWAKTVSDIILGGGLLVEVVPEVEVPPATEGELKLAYDKRLNEWSTAGEYKFSVSDKQREAIRRCIKHFAEQAGIPPNRSSAMLLTAFGYSAD